MPALNSPLATLLTGYPEAAPQTLAELHQADYDQLQQLGLDPEQLAVVLELRRHVIDAVHAADRTPLTSPEVVLEELSKGRIRPLAKKWLVLALDARKERIAVPRTSGGLRYLTGEYRRVPTAAQVLDDVPLPPGGRYLVIYGGSPELIAVSTVAEELAALQQGAPISDVLFWHLETGQAPALYSLRAGVGDRDGEPVAFPDPSALHRAHVR